MSESPGQSEAAVGLGRKLFRGWMAVAGRFGFCQTLVVLALFYTVLIGPLALAMGLARRDYLDKRSPRADGSAWRESESAKPDLERAKLLS